MKRLLLFVLTFALIFSMVACGNDPATEPSDPSDPIVTDPTEDNTPTEEPTEAPTEEPTEEPTEPHVHNYENPVTTKEPTCDKAGEITYTCECGDTKTESVKKTGHKWGVWITTVDPTLTSTGKAERTCTACNKKESMKLDKNNPEQELKRMVGYVLDLPIFNSVDELSANAIFNWAARAGQLSSEWSDETYMVTKVYSIDKMNEHTTKYLGKTFDYLTLLDQYDNLTYDESKNQLTLVIGAFGGWPNYFMDSYTKVDDTHYTVRYYAAYEENGEAEYYGTIGLRLTDKGFVFESHKEGN